MKIEEPKQAMSHREALADRKARWTEREEVGDIPDGIKCPRCYRKTGEGRFNFDGLCDRCCRVILETFPTHWSVDGIKAAYREQRARFGTIFTPREQG